MKKATKIWLIIAACLVLLGGIVFGGVMTMLKWDFTKLSTVKYETNEYEVGEAFQNISIVTDVADIVLVPSMDSTCTVVCHEEKDAKHSVTVKDSTLVIEIVDTRKWYEHIGIGFGAPTVTVSIPQGEYGALSITASTGDVEVAQDFRFESIDISESTGDVTNYASASGEIHIKTSTGSIRMEHLSAGAVALSVSTGKVTVSGVNCQGDVTVGVSTGKAYLSDIACKNVISSGNTGDISLNNVIAAERFSIERSTGGVTLDGCDAASLWIKTSTGNVRGTLLSEKDFIANSNTGTVRVPKGQTGGVCEIQTSTGDIQIELET